MLCRWHRRFSSPTRSSLSMVEDQLAAAWARGARLVEAADTCTLGTRHRASFDPERLELGVIIEETRRV